MKIANLILPPIFGATIGLILAFLYCQTQGGLGRYELGFLTLIFGMFAGSNFGLLISFLIYKNKKRNPGEHKGAD